jgi:hypothetical protein
LHGSLSVASVGANVRDGMSTDVGFR